MLALVQNYLVSNQNIDSYRIVPKINFVFYRKSSTEPVYLLIIAVGLVTSRGLCGAFFLGTSLFLRIDCLCGPLSTNLLSSRSPPYLLGLGFHADADAAGTYYLFRICFPHVVAFFFFSYT